MGFKMRGTSMNGKSSFTTKRGKLINAPVKKFEMPGVVLNPSRDDQRINTEEYKRNLEQFSEKAGYTRGETPTFGSDDQTFSSYSDDDASYQELRERKSKSTQDEKRWEETKGLLQDYKDSDFKINLDSVTGSGKADRSNPIFREFVNKYKDNFKTDLGNKIDLTKAKSEFNKAFDLASNLDNELKVSASRGYGFDSDVPTDFMFTKDKYGQFQPKSKDRSPGDLSYFGINVNPSRYSVNPEANFNRVRNFENQEIKRKEEKQQQTTPQQPVVVENTVEELENKKKETQYNKQNFDEWKKQNQQGRLETDYDYQKRFKEEANNATQLIDNDITMKQKEEERGYIPITQRT